MSANMQINTTIGVKGSDVYDSTGDPRVDLAARLVRGLSADEIRDGIDKIFKLKTREAFIDAFVLAFQTRAVRGGKGERELGYTLLTTLFEQEWVVLGKLIDLIPHYGSWRDVFHLAQTYEPMRNQLLDFAVMQLAKDQRETDNTKLSLCAKWAPREGSKGNLAIEMAKRAYPNVKDFSGRMRAYRKLVADINKRLATVEINMCGGDWASIKPAAVPGRCLHKNRKAFMNEKRKTRELRHPDNPDRMLCRDHFVDHLAKAAVGEAKINGSKTVMPHEVVEAILSKGHAASNDEKNLWRSQWRGFVDDARLGGALTRCIAMADVSGSMEGLPMSVSIALGLLVAEVNGTNRVLTFESEPRWVILNPLDDIIARVTKLKDAPWGGSTDFQKAMDLVLADVKSRRLKADQIPRDLLVFTDMGFDAACSSSSTSSYTGNDYRHVVKTAGWQTHIQMMREAWRRAGEDMHGTPFEPPRIVVWNLRGDAKDFHATSDEQGVALLAGWSPSLFKVLLDEGARVMTPYETLRAQLDDPLYDPVRKIVADYYDHQHFR